METNRHWQRCLSVWLIVASSIYWWSSFRTYMNIMLNTQTLPTPLLWIAALNEWCLSLRGFRKWKKKNGPNVKLWTSLWFELFLYCEVCLLLLEASVCVWVKVGNGDMTSDVFLNFNSPLELEGGSWKTKRFPTMNVKGLFQRVIKYGHGCNGWSVLLFTCTDIYFKSAKKVF